MEQAKDVEEDDYENRYTRQPKNDIAEHGTTPLSRGGAPAIAEDEARWNAAVTVLPAPDRGPPSCTEGEDQPCSRDEAHENCPTSGLIGRLTRGIGGSVDPLLGLLLGHTCALRNELCQVSSVFRRQRTGGGGAREHAGYLRSRLIRSTGIGRPCSRRVRPRR
jgi:hypothetical protein